MEILELKARVKRLNASIAFLDKKLIKELALVKANTAGRTSCLSTGDYQQAKVYDKAASRHLKESDQLYDAIVLMSQERNALGKTICRMRQAEYEERRQYERMMAAQKAKEELELAAMRRKVGWILINGKQV